MKTITITLTIPDDVAVAVQTEPPTNLNHSSVIPQSASPQAAVAPSASTWPAGSCPIHGAEKWKDSKYGGHYCTAKDDSQERGYCTIKSGILFNGKRVPQ